MATRFNESVDNYADVMTIKEWEESVNCGCFIPDDGVGYYGTENAYSPKYDSFGTPPVGATHVHWYNK